MVPIFRIKTGKIVRTCFLVQVQSRVWGMFRCGFRGRACPVFQEAIVAPEMVARVRAVDVQVHREVLRQRSG